MTSKQNKDELIYDYDVPLETVTFTPGVVDVIRQSRDNASVSRPKSLFTSWRTRAPTPSRWTGKVQKEKKRMCLEHGDHDYHWRYACSNFEPLNHSPPKTDLAGFKFLAIE
jgi:hypothetical protein